MTDALPLDGAASKLGRSMLELARAVHADQPPTVLEVRHISSVADIAVMLAWVDVQAEYAVCIPLNVLMTEGESISQIVARLERVAPRLDAPLLH